MLFRIKWIEHLTGGASLRQFVRARFWRIFREPVDLDLYRQKHGYWPRHTVEGDFYTSFGKRFAITNGCWRPMEIENNMNWGDGCNGAE
jgi:hypothetical protein